jgi:hypothetical protein
MAGKRPNKTELDTSQDFAVPAIGANNGLTISHDGLSITINDENLVDLNGIWRDAGSPKNREPKEWAKLPSAKEFLANLAKNSNGGQSPVWKTQRGKATGGTWGHWKAAVEYAGYLSPEFKSRVYDALREWAEEQADPGLKIERGVLGAKYLGWSDERIKARFDGIMKRNVLTDTLQAHKIERRGYAICSDEINKPILGGTAAQFKAREGIPPKALTRDHIPSPKLNAIAFAESMAAAAIDARDANGTDQCAKVCRAAAEAAANAMKAMGLK